MWLPLTTHLEGVQGDDWKAADGRALVWSSPSWPNLASAHLSMIVGHNQVRLGTLPVTWTGTVPSTASPSSISLDVPAALTSVLGGGEYDYILTAVLPDGDKVTIAAGQLSVIPIPSSLNPPLV